MHESNVFPSWGIWNQCITTFKALTQTRTTTLFRAFARRDTVLPEQAAQAANLHVSGHQLSAHGREPLLQHCHMRRVQLFGSLVYPSLPSADDSQLLLRR